MFKAGWRFIYHDRYRRQIRGVIYRRIEKIGDGWYWYTEIYNAEKHHFERASDFYGVFPSLDDAVAAANERRKRGRE